MSTPLTSPPSPVAEKIPPAPAPANPAAEAENPWPGLDFYTEKTSHHFHGRTEESQELLSRVRRRRITVLYGQSGLGKSSVLQAGLFPLLRADGWVPIYIRLRYSSIGTEGGALEPLAAQALKEIAGAIRAELKAGRLRLPGAAGSTPTPEAIEAALPHREDTMWEYLHRPGLLLLDHLGRSVALVLAFDQFEEMFTLGRNVSRHIGRTEFMRDFAHCAEEEPQPNRDWLPGDDGTSVSRWGDHRLVVSLREDFLAQLNDLGWQMPTLLENQMHLRPLTGWQALDAVAKPARSIMEPLVARQIVESVAAKRRDDADGDDSSSGLAAGEGEEYTEMKVDPAILSMACRELNEARKRDAEAKIKGELVTRLLHDDEQSIFRRFYEESFAPLADGEAPVLEKHLIPEVKRFIEENLLQGQRRDVMNYERAKAVLLATGVEDPEAVFGKLIDRRLLRKSPGRGGTAVVLELTHDVLCDAVAHSREERREQEAEEKRRDALQAAAAHAQELQRQVDLFKSKRVLLRALCVVGILLAIALAATAFFGRKLIAIGKEAEKKAVVYLEKARPLAEAPAVQQADNAWKALRYAISALKLDAGNADAARIASRLLLEQPWAVPLSPPLKNERPYPLVSTAFTPDGKALVAVTGEGQLLSWDAQRWGSPTERSILNPALVSDTTRTPVSSAAFSGDGRNLLFTWTEKPGPDAANAPAPGGLMVQNTKAAVWRWKGSAYEAAGIEFNLPASARSVSWSDDGQVLLVLVWRLGEMSCQVFDLSSGAAVPLAGPLTAAGQSIAAADLSSDGGWIATSNSAGVIQMWGVPGLQLGSLQLTPRLVPAGSRVFALSLSRDRTRLVTTGSQQSARVWLLGGAQPTYVETNLPGASSPVMRAALNPDPKGAAMMATGVGKMTLLWDLQNELVRVGQPLRVEEAFSTPSFSADGARLITLAGDNWTQGETIRVWRAQPLPPAPPNAGAAFTGRAYPPWLIPLAEAITGSRLTLDLDNTTAETLEQIADRFPDGANSGEYRPIWERFFTK